MISYDTTPIWSYYMIPFFLTRDISLYFKAISGEIVHVRGAILKGADVYLLSIVLTIFIVMMIINVYTKMPKFFIIPSSEFNRLFLKSPILYIFVATFVYKYGFHKYYDVLVSLSMYVLLYIAMYRFHKKLKGYRQAAINENNNQGDTHCE